MYFITVKEKMDIETDRLVLECDGTVIDDDEVLQQLTENIFIVLQTGEEWSCPDNSKFDQIPNQPERSEADTSSSSAKTNAPAQAVQDSIRDGMFLTRSKIILVLNACCQNMRCYDCFFNPKVLTSKL